MIILVAALAIIAGAFAFRERRRADQFQKRCISLGTELACRGARVKDLIEHGRELTAGIETLRVACEQRDQRVNHLLDTLRMQDEYIADQAKIIQRAQRHVPVNNGLLFPN